MKHRIHHYFAAGLLVLACSSMAQAQATRTYVSGTGSDANPCSRTAPCRTFQGALPNTAAGGEINVLDPGGFGAVAIDKSITIDGGPGVAGILVAGQNGITVNDGGAGTAVVTVRNLDIDGINTSGIGLPGIRGIHFVSGARLTVENCKIYGFTSAGVHAATGSTHLVGNTILNNHTGTNDIPGVLADGASVKLTAENNQIVNNDVGVQVLNGATAVISNNGIYNNGTALAGCAKDPAVGTITTFRNNRIEGGGGGPVAACKPLVKAKQQ